MKFFFHRNFKKSVKRAPGKVRVQLREQLNIFSENPFDKRLHNHPLQGKYIGHKSINITGDWRVIFKEINQETVLMVEIGTHSQLYG